MSIYGTTYKPFSYVKADVAVAYLVEKAGWVLRQRDADHGVLVAPQRDDNGGEIFFPVYRSHATSARAWAFSEEQLHKYPGILSTLAALYGGTARDMATEISGIYETIVGRDNAGHQRFVVCFGLYKPIPPSFVAFMPVIFSMGEMLENGERVTCYGFARSEADIPEGAVIENVSVSSAVALGWSYEKASLYDEEGVEGWRWTSPAGDTFDEIGGWNEAPVVPEAARHAVKRSEQADEAGRRG